MTTVEITLYERNGLWYYKHKYGQSATGWLERTECRAAAEASAREGAINQSSTYDYEV